MKKIVSFSLLYFLFQPSLYSEESIIDAIEDYSKSKLTKIICESDKSIQETLVRPLNGKSQTDSRVTDKLLFRLALNDDFLLHKHERSEKWLLLHSTYDGNVRNGHKERNNKPGDEAELTFTDESINYMLKKKISDTEVIGQITLKITDYTEEWNVDRGTGYFSHFTQETNLTYDQNGRYLGDGLSMINSEGYCSIEKEKKF